MFSTILPPLLRGSRHPGIEVVPLEASDHEIETLLAAGTVDLGVVLNAPPDSGVCPLGEDDWVAVVPAASAGARTRRRRGAGRPGGTALRAGHRRRSVNAGSVAEQAGLALCDVRATVTEWSSAFALVREAWA